MSRSPIALRKRLRARRRHRDQVYALCKAARWHNDVLPRPWSQWVGDARLSHYATAHGRPTHAVIVEVLG